MLSVVGIGPGSLDLMTERARARISSADVIMGNVRYIELIKDVIPASAEVVIGRMGTEVERAKKAVELGQYKDVVLVSGGDAGIYGGAGNRGCCRFGHQIGDSPRYNCSISIRCITRCTHLK